MQFPVQPSGLPEMGLPRFGVFFLPKDLQKIFGKVLGNVGGEGMKNVDRWAERAGGQENSSQLGR